MMRNRNQVVLPFDYEKNISAKDPVRKLIEICDELDYTELFEAYVRTWRKHNPITLFEIIVYGYMQGKYSGREIEEACNNDIRFMWILNGEGNLLRVNRSIQVEGAFGVLKQDFRFRRFLTRGNGKVKTQFFLLAFAFNIQKLCNRLKSGRFGQDLFLLKNKTA